MKPSTHPIKLFILTCVLLCGSALGSSISGTVYDNRQSPVADVDVELLDDLSRFRARTATDGNGRYEFGGLGDGRYTVRVLPLRYDLIPQEQPVEIVTVSAIGQVTSVTEFKDFYLTPRRGSITDVEASVVVAQEIPKEARAAYEKAVDDLAKKRTDQGITGLLRAIEIFPDYFVALQRLANEHFLRGRYSEAIPLAVRAAEVSDKSPLSFYILGYSLHKLGYNKAAIVSLRRAAVLSPASVAILFSLGVAERMEGLYTEAEAHLARAKRLVQTPFAELHWQLAVLYGENLGRYAEAADEFEQFLKARPNAKDADKIRTIIKSYRAKSKLKTH